VSDTLRRLQELRHVLQRLGAQQAARYWSNQPRVFASNLFGGAVVGAVAFVVAALLLGLDVRRGDSSIIANFARAAQDVVATLKDTLDREMRGL
jgi:site-specific recombinase